MHYYKRNIGDYYKKAGRLTMMQHGAYTLLIDACYDRERFPTLSEAIEWAWASSDEEIASIKFVLGKFFTEVDGVFIQNHIKDDLASYAEKAKINQRIAIEREEKRRLRSTKRAQLVNESCESVNESTPEHHEPPPNQEPLTINQEPIDKDIKDLSANADNDQVISEINQTDHDKEERPLTTDNRVIEIFHYWCDSMRKNRLTAKMTPKRTKAIRDRLKQGYTMDDIKLAIYNCSQDPWSMGNNDRQKPFNDIELICRSGEKLESYLDAVQQKAAARNVNSIGTDFSPPKGWNT